jgi:hypothetical protein
MLSSFVSPHSWPSGITASYWHVSTKILDEFPQVMDKVSYELGTQKQRIEFSMESKVDDLQKKRLKTSIGNLI